MIKLKTWEMIKSISEDKSKRFKTSLGSHIVGLNSKGVLSWLAIHKGEIESDFRIGSTDYWSNLNIDWEEVLPEPVDFITAINSGKRIKFSPNDVYEYHTPNWFIDNRSLSLQNINGNWYIEN